MKHVVNTNEIAHLWANRTQADARNPQRNLYFRDSTLFSYRDSFPIARHVVGVDGSAAVLITTNKFSVTTTGHISLARQSSRHIQQFFVWKVYATPTEQLKAFAAQVIDKQRDIYVSRTAAKRARLHEDLVAFVAECNAYAAFFGMSERFDTGSSEIQLAEFAEYAEQLKAQRKAEIAADKARQAQRLLDAADKIQAWINGEQYSRIPYEIKQAYLRIEGEEVVTSKGARIPLDHALRGLAVIEAARNAGRAYVRNGHTIHLGHYAIDKIDAEGNLTAGCHYIEYAEIARLAPQVLAATSAV